jgi:hypothetical protein
MNPSKYNIVPMGIWPGSYKCAKAIKKKCQCNVVNSGNTVQLQNLENTVTNQVFSLLMIDKRNFMLWNSTLIK